MLLQITHVVSATRAVTDGLAECCEEVYLVDGLVHQREGVPPFLLVHLLGYEGKHVPAVGICKQVA